MVDHWFLHNVHLIPGSKLNKVIGFMDDGSLKIRIKEKPVEGRANKGLIKYLSDLLDIREFDIEIISGISSRNKIIRIRNIDSVGLQQKVLGKRNQEP
jgi:uncharacterized protein